MAVIGVNITNFPQSAVGKVTGVLLLFYGLSGTVYSQIYSNFYYASTGGYLLFLAISSAAINFVGLTAIQRVPLASHHHQVTPRVSNSIKPDNKAPPQPPQLPSIEKQDSILTIPELLIATSVSNSTASFSPAGQPVSVTASMKRLEVKNSTLSLSTSRKSMNPIQILKSPVFWLYTTCFTFQQGLTYITNISSIIAAMEGPAMLPDASNSTTIIAPTDNTNLVALHLTICSVFQAAGRLFTGVSLDLPIFSERGYDRTLLLAFFMVFLEMPHLLIAFVGSAGMISRGLLAFCSSCVGLGLGSVGALFPPLTKEYFGNSYYGTACGFVFATVPLGILLSNQVFGILYDRNSVGSHLVLSAVLLILVRRRKKVVKPIAAS
ncbi:hypothetical protein HDU97_007004 [Phlyctochytrium planicorne]|nr:hypothetical protein HDU97_007004 [Phlyctochytrium planicorne]